MGTLLVAQGASTSGAQGAAGVAAAIALFLRNGAVAGRGLQPVTARRRLVLSASRLVHFKKEVKSACALTLETPQVGMPHCVRRLFSVAAHSLSPRRFRTNFFRALQVLPLVNGSGKDSLLSSRLWSFPAGEAPATG